ncbi:MAG: HEAT repeat domain-containing protein [Firmicutes bacterium]|nr:HEAT repeat domain-containing protein [Bacillota bacterium]
MDGQTNAGNAGKENKKAFRQISIVAFIVLVIFAVRHFSHQYYMDQIDKASAGLHADKVETRLAAVEALREIGELEAKVALLTALKDKNSDVRVQAAAALYGWKDERALAALLVTIKDKDDDVRNAAASSLVIFARADTSASEVTGQQKESASSALEEAFQAKDYPAIAGAVNYFIEKGEDGTESRLISALKACGTKGMAEVYLNCGNAELMAAAEQWAEKHNYMIQTWQGNQPIAVGATWGSGRSK